jgi:hypothetical protein
MSDWKQMLLKGFGWGIGTAIGLGAIVGGYLWYEGRPKPPKPWTTTAILCTEDSPGFYTGNSGKEIRFTYTLQNATDADYEIGPETEIRITFKNNDGSLTEPLPNELVTLRRPVFIPAKQKAMASLSIVFSDVPQKKMTETDEVYHERLRAFCRQEMGDSGFTLFDVNSRYQLNLPAVKAEKPQKPS